MRSVGKKITRNGRAVLAQHLTVKIVPETTGDAISFRISTIVILFCVLLIGSVFVGFVHLHRLSADKPTVITEQQADLQNLQANLDEALQELHAILRASRPLEEELDIFVAGYTPQTSYQATPATLNRTQVADFYRDLTREERSPDTTLREVEELQSLITTLSETQNVLGQTRSLLATTESYLRDVPHFWPVVNGLGVVTMEYGPNLHPFTGQWYLHKGFDIAGPVGLPLVATADGVVVESAFDLGYGNNIVIRHRYGFYTRYAHLNQVFVREGQRVSQGERIGTLGASGMVSGPHLHLEVIIGNEVLDPAPFLMISNTFERGGTASSRRR